MTMPALPTLAAGAVGGDGTVLLVPRLLPSPPGCPATATPAMEAAARPSGHKRNFSAYDTQLASFDPSGKAARPSEEPAPGAEQEQPEEQPLTESAQFNLEALRTSQEEVIRQIDELQGAPRPPHELAGGRRRHSCLRLSLPLGYPRCHAAWPGATVEVVHALSNDCTAVGGVSSAAACEAAHLPHKCLPAFRPVQRWGWRSWTACAPASWTASPRCAGQRLADCSERAPHCLAPRSHRSHADAAAAPARCIPAPPPSLPCPLRSHPPLRASPPLPLPALPAV